MDIIAYTDGACKGNNGRKQINPGGWGYFFDFNAGGYNIRISDYGGEANTTNQKMELQALLELLKEMPAGYHASIFSDSHYVLKGFVSEKLWGKPIDKYLMIDGWIKGWRKKNYQDVKNVDRWKAIDELIRMHLSKGTVLYFNYVKGHSGDYGNDLADKLSNDGAALYL